MKPHQRGIKLGNVALPLLHGQPLEKKSSKIKQFGDVSEPKEPEMKRFYFFVNVNFGTQKHRIIWFGN